MRFSKLNRTFLFATIVTVALASSALAGHPYHVSMTEIDFNPATQSFEVAMCVWPGDLEKALSQHQKRAEVDAAFDIEQMQPAELNALMREYVGTRFRMLNEDATAGEISWVGHEVESKAVWMYFEVAADDAPDQWSLENRVMFECNESQMNHHMIKIGKRRLALESTSDSAVLSLDET